MDTQAEDLVGAAWVAKRLGISPYTVYPYAKSGKIPCIRIGKSLRFRPSDIERFIESKSVQADK